MAEYNTSGFNHHPTNFDFQKRRFREINNKLLDIYVSQPSRGGLKAPDNPASKASKSSFPPDLYLSKKITNQDISNCTNHSSFLEQQKEDEKSNFYYNDIITKQRPNLDDIKVDVSGLPGGYVDRAPPCIDIIKEICGLFFEKEKTPDFLTVDYMEYQKDITPKMRSIVVDWLVDVCLKFRHRDETFYLAVKVLDRYLNRNAVTRHGLQLVGITALLVAAKYEEMWAPEIKECVKITANTYTRDEVLEMERSICTSLKFRFTCPTAYVFATQLTEGVNTPEELRHAMFFFLEIAQMDYEMTKYLPSKVACAAFLLAKYLIFGSSAILSLQWPHQFVSCGRYNLNGLIEIADRLLNFTNKSLVGKCQAVRRKYSSHKYSEISKKNIPKTLDIRG